MSMPHPVPKRIIHRVQRWYRDRQVGVLAPFLSPDDELLDFGCGDGSLGEGLAARIPGLRITGVDVVNSPARPGVRFVKYAGDAMPFGDRSFDVLLAYHVLHHCGDPAATLRECCRVARRRIIMVEPTFRSALDLPAMRGSDWLFNAWKPEPVPMPYTFQRRDRWRQLLAECGFSIEREDRVGVFPSWFPIGETVLFSATRA